VADDVAHTCYKTPTACAQAVAGAVRAFDAQLAYAWHAVTTSAQRRLAGESMRLRTCARHVALGTRHGLAAADAVLSSAGARLSRSSDNALTRAARGLDRATAARRHRRAGARLRPRPHAGPGLVDHPHDRRSGRPLPRRRLDWRRGGDDAGHGPGDEHRDRNRQSRRRRLRPSVPRRSPREPGVLTMTDDAAVDAAGAGAGGQAIGYAAALTELDDILHELDGDEVDVDVLGARVRRAAELLRVCRDRISSARFEVEQVVAELEAEADAGAVVDQPDDAQA
jgi:exodeoxyribonuclease VII small subunit